MIKFQFRIIVDKKGIKRTIKPFLGRSVSTLALVLSVVALSTLIGLGIRLVFAAPFTNPTAEPPLGNVDAPINVSSTAQTKSGDIRLEDLHLNATGNEGSIYNADIVQGYNDLRLWGNSARNATVWIDSPATITQDLTVSGNLVANNNSWGPGWSSPDCSPYNSDKYYTCPQGSYVRSFILHDNGKIKSFRCQAL